MSTYKFTENDGTKLIARPSTFGGELWLSLEDSRAKVGMYLPIAEAPTFAAELLKAAGQESVIAPKSTNPVEVRQFDQLRCGDAATHVDADPAKLRGFAADFIAIAEYIESAAAREAAKKAEAGAAEKKLQERRDALRREMGFGYRYEMSSAGVQRAINRIIELEDGASCD